MNLRRKLAFFMALSRYVEMIVSGIPPLSLAKAKADSLTSVKAFGGTEQGGVPSGYTALEYVENATRTLVPTDFIPVGVTSVKVDLMTTASLPSAATGRTFYIFQARETTATTIFGISGAQSSLAISGSGTNNAITSSITRTNGNKYRIVWEATNGTQTLTVDDLTAETTDTKTNTYTTIADVNSPMCLFGNAGTLDPSGTATEVNRIYQRAQVYYAKLWANGKLVLDLVPAKRNSDNAVGLYNRVNGAFFTATEGSLTAGNEITPTTSDPIDIYCNNGKISVLDHTNWNVITNPTSQTGQGMFINSDGKLQRANDRGAGVFIPVTVGKQYTLLINKKNTALGSIIRYGQSNNGDLPNSAEQLLDWYRGAIEEMMMISFTAKRPYFVMQLAASLVEAGGIDEAVEVIEAAGDNETIAIDGTRYIDPSDCVIGKYIDNSGAIATNAANYYCNTYFAVEPNTTYTMKTESDVWSFNIAEYDSGKTFIQRTLDPTPHGNKTEFSITTSATTRFIRVGNNTSPDGGTSNPTTLAIIQSLKPRIDGIHCSATANNLFAINTYKDVQEIITGVTKHKVNVYVLNGEETAWNDVVSGSSYAMPKTALGSDSNVLPNKSTDVICSHYSVATESGVGVQDIIWVGGSNVNFKTKATYATLQDWKDYLAAQYAAGTPVIVIVPFATEYTEPEPVPQTMQTVAGDNILDIVQAGMSGLEVEVKYTKAKY